MSKEKMVPEIRFKGFEGEWDLTPVSDLMTFSNGINASKESYGKGRKMISVMDVLDDSRMKYENIRNSVDVSEHVESKYRVGYGDLVFVRSSEVVDEVGWTKAYQDETYALYSGFSIRGKKKAEYDPLFLELSINSKTRNQIENKSGGSTRYNINQLILNELLTYLPRLDEQAHISNLFDALSIYTLSKHKEVNQLHNFKQAMLQKMFPKEGEKVPEIRFEGFKGEWQFVKLNATLQNEFKGKAQAEKLLPGSNEYLDANRLNGGNPICVNSDVDVLKDDILILWDGSKAGTVYHGFKGVLGSTLKALKINEHYDATFIYHYLNGDKHNIFTNYRTPNIPHVIRDFTKRYELPITTLEEQNKIGEYFKTLDINIQAKQKELEKLKQFKQAMLQKMFV